MSPQINHLPNFRTESDVARPAPRRPRSSRLRFGFPRPLRRPRLGWAA